MIIASAFGRASKAHLDHQPTDARWLDPLPPPCAGTGSAHEDSSIRDDRHVTGTPRRARRSEATSCGDLDVPEPSPSQNRSGRPFGLSSCRCDTHIGKVVRFDFPVTPVFPRSRLDHPGLPFPLSRPLVQRSGSTAPAERRAKGGAAAGSGRSGLDCQRQPAQPTSAPGTTVSMGSSPSTPAVAWQPSLWADQSTVVDVSFCGLERTQLDGDSWVDHCPSWMAGSDRAFEELLRDVAWSQRRRWMYDREVDEPRLTSWQRIDEKTAVAYRWLEDARASLSAYYEVRFDSVGINLYRDGADSVAWHRDRIPPEIVNPVVALVSLGAPRRFLLRPQGGGRSRVFKLGHGDLLVTGGQTQRRFEHSVPKVKASGPRMSIAFRHGVS